MADKGKFQAIKGVRDILPPDSALWNSVEQGAREVFGTFGFAEIRVPIFEPTELFARSIGTETEVVSKEMYSFEDHNFLELEQLRAALTTRSIGVDEISDFAIYERSVLAYTAILSEKFEKGEVPRTPENERILRSIPPIFERMNKFGKQFVQTQSSSEVDGFEQCLVSLKIALRSFRFGDSLSLRPEATASVVRAYIEHGMQVLPGNVKLYYMGPMFRRERPQKGRYRQFYQIGAEVIEMLLAFFERVKLQGALLSINSIGCKTCRPAYVEKLRGELQKVREQLGADSQRRIETNPLRVLDSKLEHEQAIIEKLPRIAEHLCPDCKTHYDEVKRQLGLRGIVYQENWRLVRGLDYYMRTTFEITAPGLGSQNAVCGGGRYDGLVELLGGQASTKGIGFAIGTDRLILSLQEQGAGVAQGGLDVYLVWFGATAQAAAIGLAKRLRDAGLVVELAATEMKFGKALGLADGTQQKLAEPELLAYFK